MTREPFAGADPYTPPAVDLLGPSSQVPTQPPAEGVRFLPRAGARLIDLVVHYVVALLAGLATGLAIGLYATARNVPVEPLLARLGEAGPFVFVISLLGWVASETVSEGLAGTTPGKLLFGLIVIREDGAPCTFPAAVRRSLAYLLDALFFGAVAYQSMNRSPLQQRYGDRWARTVVVRRSTLPAQRVPSSALIFFAILAGLAADGALLVAGWLIHIL